MGFGSRTMLGCHSSAVVAEYRMSYLLTGCWNRGAWNHKKWKKRPYFYGVERFHLNGADSVFATSDLEAQNLNAFVANTTQVRTIPLALPNDVRPDYSAARDQLEWEAGETVLLYLSRIHEKKGMHLLLDALTGISTHDRVRLVVVGDGPEKYVQRLKDFEAKISEQLPQIDWEGAIWGDEKWRYLQGADLFCLPTQSENFGLVVLEAAQVGTPILTTTSTPWRFLESWGAGLIVEPTMEAVRDGLIRFFGNPEWSFDERRAFADRIRGRFSLSTVGEQYVEAYQTVILHE